MKPWKWNGNYQRGEYPAFVFPLASGSERFQETLEIKKKKKKTAYTRYIHHSTDEQSSTWIGNISF